MTLFVWITVLGILQSAAQVNINFLAILVIFAGLKKGILWGALAGVFTGVFAEIFSSLPPGLNLALYAGLGLLSGIVKEKINYKEDLLTEFLFSFCGILLFYLGYFAFTRTVRADVFFTIIFSALISPLLFRMAE
ncbi:MAG: hypothetical protein WC312_04035 [Candidatus Omnitrophota bacterium]|jgi:ABC-type dipeptide/oligopeptide/nickel transport system permease subunit